MQGLCNLVCKCGNSVYRRRQDTGLAKLHARGISSPLPFAAGDAAGDSDLARSLQWRISRILDTKHKQQEQGQIETDRIAAASMHAVTAVHPSIVSL